MRTMASPVLPEPVMPTIRPWVRRSDGVQDDPLAQGAGSGIDLLAEVESVLHESGVYRIVPRLQPVLDGRQRSLRPAGSSIMVGATYAQGVRGTRVALRSVGCPALLVGTGWRNS